MRAGMGAARVGGHPHHQRQYLRPRAARRLGGGRCGLPARQSRRRRQVQHLRPRELQEIDPQLADRRLAGRGVLVRRQPHAPVRQPGLLAGRERSLQRRASGVDVAAAAHRPGYGRRPQYGVPYSYYQIGLYFRRDLLRARRRKRRPPRMATLLVETCDEAESRRHRRRSRSAPRTSGPPPPGSTTSTCGCNGHRLPQGADGAARSPYTDARVRAVFASWRELLDRGCFAENHASRSGRKARRCSTRAGPR